MFIVGISVCSDMFFLKFPGWVTIGYYLLIDTTPAGKTTGFRVQTWTGFKGSNPGQ